ncbi:ANK1 [Symbiodinium natans]|uniref:ANK1 protein n=1 Tax=Symbiodinium natans TaxID=878477 RepID=A0A812MRX0_9DINO|nr:ANK1 [Symbiodinium natans]
MDSASFLEFYEHTLLAFKDLAPHQKKHLQDIQRFDEVHLSAPAGAGKTFVAVQRVIDALTEETEKAPAHVLYVAPTVELTYYFIQWMIVRLASQAESRLVSEINELLQRMVVLHSPYQALLSPRLDEKDRRITLEVAGSIDTFGLTVMDESHNLYAEGVDQGILADLKSRRRLLLSDESQAATVSTRFPEMHRANLREVVRSTRQIVLGARSFRSDTGAVTSTGTDGPPLKSYLFDASDAKGEFELYAQHVADAMGTLQMHIPTSVSTNDSR